MAYIQIETLLLNSGSFTSWRSKKNKSLKNRKNIIRRKEYLACCSYNDDIAISCKVDPRISSPIMILTCNRI